MVGKRVQILNSGFATKMPHPNVPVLEKLVLPAEDQLSVCILGSVCDHF